MRQATNLREIKHVLDPRALSPEDLDTFFVETGPARDPFMNRRLELAEKLSESDAATKVLFAGEIGAGNTTEL